MNEYRFEYPSPTPVIEVNLCSWFPELKTPISSDFFSLFGLPRKIWSSGAVIPEYTPSLEWDFNLYTRGIRYEGNETGTIYRIYVPCYNDVNPATMDTYFKDWSWL